jgi:hypothetical protein
MWPLVTQCRTGSGSDLVAYETLNYAQLFDFGEKTNSLSNAIRPGRYHHPNRAARLGTPVRSRFRIEC